MPAAVITFLSDYGVCDEFVGVCHGVIARRCPDARVIDISHAIPARDVRTGALVLSDALPFMPGGVHLAVVDPQVGASGGQARRAVAVRVAVEDRLLVGPDNGLLAPAAERLGGAVEAVEISRSPERLTAPSSTFHGRDVFAPVAAALAAGRTPADVGETIDPASLRSLELSRARAVAGGLHAHVLRIDHFGNLVLDAEPTQLAQAGLDGGEVVSLRAAGRSFQLRRGAAFADVPGGELLLYEDATGRLAIAVNGGSAAERLGLAAGADVAVIRG